MRLLDSGNSITVYDDSMSTRFVSFMCSPTVLTPIDRFVKQLTFAFDMNINLSEKEALAFELYISSYYEASKRAKFLTLVITLESLIECNERRQEAKKHVEQLIELTKSSTILSKQEAESMIGSLTWLNQESISRSGKNLVEKYIGKNIYNGTSAKKFFEYCYNNRSSLVHYGKMDKDVNLLTLIMELNKMVSDLLVEIIRFKSAVSDDT